MKRTVCILGLLAAACGSPTAPTWQHHRYTCLTEQRSYDAAGNLVATTPSVYVTDAPCPANHPLVGIDLK